MKAHVIHGPADIAAIEAAGYPAFMPYTSVPQALAAVAAAHGARPALTWLPSADPAVAAEVWTHAELLHRMRQTANLLHTLGVDDTRATAFLLPAMPAAYLALLGGETAGRVCPINYLLDVDHIAGLIGAAQARVLIALAPGDALGIGAKARQLQRLCPGLRHVLWVHAGSDDGGDVDGFERRIAAQRGDGLDFTRAIGRDTVAATFHTGGTTGAPKLAQHTHGNQLHTAWSAVYFYASDEHDTMINGFPLFHVAGAFVFGLSTLLAGGNVVLPTLQGLRNPAFVQRYWSFVQRHRVTLLAAVPTVISALLNVDPGGADIRSVRALLTGGSPLPDELAAAFERRFGIPVRNILGMTECAGIISIESFHAPRVAGSCGLALPFTEVRAIAGDAMPPRVLPPGDTGILALRGPHVGPGYTEAPRNAGTFESGWLITGDIGHVAADGRIFITGRAKDVIIRSSHNIDPGVIEEALLGHPDVALAAAVGEPDEYAGEVPVAFVVLKPGSKVDEAALLQHALPRFPERPAVPKRLTIIDQMPMTAIGKVYKPALRQRAVEQALRERLARAGLAAAVSVQALDEPRGIALRFGIRRDDDFARHNASVQSLMAPFALPYRIDATDGPAA